MRGTKLQSRLDYFDLLDSSQFGFKPHLLNSRAVSDTLQYTCNKLDKGTVVISIFLVLAKAFDNIYHDFFFLKNLSKCGIRGAALKC